MTAKTALVAILAVGIGGGIAGTGSVAEAQPNVRDKRQRDRDPDDNTYDKRDKRDKRDRGKGAPARIMKPPDGPIVTGYRPRSGAANTEVTIRGRALPDNVVVQIGGQRVRPTFSGPRRVTFKVPPRVRPGKRRVALIYRGKPIPVGDFDVDGAATGPDRHDEDPGAPDESYRPDGADQPPDNIADKRDRARPGDRPDRGDRRDAWRDRRRRYHRDRVLVSRYFPRKGAAGTQVTIRGAGFTPDVEVRVSGRPVRAKVKNPRTIVFTMPASKANDIIRLRAGGRVIPVGPFEVVDGYDYKAERKRLAAERRAAAEAAWKDRKARLAKDRAERERAFRARRIELDKTRAERRARRIAKIRERFERAFLRDPETRAELALHADRVARLERMRRLAELNESDKLVIRIEIAMRREDDRHDRRMSALRATFAAGGE